MREAQKHAELIKQWADGAEIERFCTVQDIWHDEPSPSWNPQAKYRIKPKPEYPITLMTKYELVNERDSVDTMVEGMFAIANAAIRHAIDSGQVIIAPKGE